MPAIGEREDGRKERREGPQKVSQDKKGGIKKGVLIKFGETLPRTGGAVLVWGKS